MTPIKQAFARKLLLGIGLDPEVFVKQVQSGKEASFLITRTIQVRDQLYHPDSGWRKDSEDFQKWSEIREAIKQFSPDDIYRSLKSEKTSKKSPKTQRIVEEAQEETQAKLKDVILNFGLGTYQRELTRNLAGRYFVLDLPHQVYGHSIITLDSLLEFPPFQEILEKEMEKRKLENASEKISKLTKKSKYLRNRTKSLEGKISWINKRVPKLRELELKLKDMSNPNKIYDILKQYQSSVENEIRDIGYSDLLDRLHIVKNKRQEENEKLHEEFTAAKKQIKKQAMQEISSLKNRIMSINNSDDLAKLALSIENYASKNMEIGDIKEKVKKIRISEGRRKDLDLLYEMASLLDNMGDKITEERIRVKKIRDNSGYNTEYLRANQELISVLPFDLIRMYSGSRAFINRFTGGGPVKITQKNLKKYLKAKNQEENPFMRRISTLASRIKAYDKSDDLAKLASLIENRAEKGLSVFNLEKRLKKLKIGSERSKDLAFLKEMASLSDNIVEGDRFYAKRAMVLSRIREESERFGTYKESLAEELKNANEQISTNETELSRYEIDPPEVEISSGRIMSLFFDEGPKFFKAVYTRRRTPKPEMSPLSLIYIDDKLSIHYFNVSGTEQSFPLLKDFKSTNRQIAGLLPTIADIRSYMLIKGNFAYLSGDISRKIKDEIIPVDVILNSGCYEKLATTPERKFFILSAEPSEGRELYRIEGEIASQGYKKINRSF